MHQKFLKQMIVAISQVYQDNHASTQQQHFEAVDQRLPQGFQPATDTVDVLSLPDIKPP